MFKGHPVSVMMNPFPEKSRRSVNYPRPRGRGFPLHCPALPAESG